MDIQYYGANCVRITTKKANIVIDDNLKDLGAKSPTKAGDIAIFTGPHAAPTADTKIDIDQPGEYEVSDTSIRGIAARAHIDEAGQKNATIFKFIAEDIRVVALGHIYPELNDRQLEEIGTVDVLIVPVGGNGYTLDPVGALKVVKSIDPKIIIPTHYADKDINYPVVQQELEETLKTFPMEPKEKVAKLKIKPSELAENAQLVPLERQ